jgi:hypothetical protein
VIEALRALAMKLDGVTESVSCKGTALESCRFSVGKHAFLFVSESRAMVRLGPSQAEARELATERPERHRIGANGWATVTIEKGEKPPLPLLRRWIAEGHGLAAAGKPAAKGKAAARKGQASAAKTRRRTQGS